eukprot:TRINITY_DN89383_c0_g1_i1.p1 TRINITY_DN89383_c0_g1~~TRINITY_DN89383_c0_g1_i1.p1  ORF type:complete len:454 (+),score=38.21 TRINITY_DN89383_c0_g1_i1:53-1363(+)
MTVATVKQEHQKKNIILHTTIKQQSSSKRPRAACDYLNPLVAAERVAQHLRILAAQAQMRYSEIESREEELQEKWRSVGATPVCDYNGMVSADDPIRLNVGGEQCTVKRDVLTAVPGSLLASLFSGRWDKSLLRDEDDRIFLDVDTIIFRDTIVDILLQIRTSGGKYTDYLLKSRSGYVPARFYIELFVKPRFQIEEVAMNETSKKAQEDEADELNRITALLSRRMMRQEAGDVVDKMRQDLVSFASVVGDRDAVILRREKQLAVELKSLEEECKSVKIFLKSGDESDKIKKVQVLGRPVTTLQRTLQPYEHTALAGRFLRWSTSYSVLDVSYEHVSCLVDSFRRLRIVKTYGNAVEYVGDAFHSCRDSVAFQQTAAMYGIELPPITANPHNKRLPNRRSHRSTRQQHQVSSTRPPSRVQLINRRLSAICLIDRVI